MHHRRSARKGRRPSKRQLIIIIIMIMIIMIMIIMIMIIMIIIMIMMIMMIMIMIIIYGRRPLAGSPAGAARRVRGAGGAAPRGFGARASAGAGRAR